MDIICSFADDERILLWDLYNEPGNSGNGEKSLPLLESVFEWARAVNPSQPLTAGVWFDNKKLNDFQLTASDIITFHNYCPADNLERQIVELKIHRRPLICTKWMARTCGSLVNTNLPVFAQEKVGCLNWDTFTHTPRKSAREKLQMSPVICTPTLNAISMRIRRGGMRSTFVEVLSLKLPPSWRTVPPYASTMIFRPITKRLVGLT